MLARTSLGTGLRAAFCVSYLLVACSRDAHTAPSRDAAADLDAGSSPDGGNAALDRVYDAKHLMQVELTLAPADWARIRAEGRSVNDVFSGCVDPSFAYTEAEASVTIDGKKLTYVAVQKKGFLGSLSLLRPSLRLDFNKNAPGQSYLGLHSLTLNNGRQDPGTTHQCMAYAAFERAGVPAPRCSFAHVTVNGEDLGIYENIEPVKKDFLTEHFPDASGKLYEGSGGADFRSDMLDGFEQKTGLPTAGTPDLSPLQAVANALDKPVAQRVQAVEALVDMDEFMRFWATESLIAHWDGYTGDLNNFFVYQRPDTGKLSFIPWGPDAAFEKTHPFLPTVGRPQSVYAWARLPMRLYAIASTRDRYRKTLGDLLTQSWDETKLLAEVDRIAALLGDGADAAQLEAQRTFIRGRRAELKKELDGTAPAWTFAERSHGVCVPNASTAVSGSFSTSWGDINGTAFGPSNALQVEIGNKAQTFISVLASAGSYSDATTTGSVPVPTVRVVGLRADNSFVVVQLLLGQRKLSAQQIPFHGFESLGVVAQGTSTADLKIVGLIGVGKVVLDQAGMKTGAAVAGRFEGQLIDIGQLPSANRVGL